MIPEPLDNSVPDAKQSGHGRANPTPLIILAILMIVGLSGLLGGARSSRQQVENENVILTVNTPETLRNGMIFETLVEVQAKRPVKQLTVGVSNALWRDMTINTMIPAASEEEYRDGSHHFVFSDLQPGDVFRFKVDGQINPPLFGEIKGTITVGNSNTKLATVDLRTRVLP